MTTPLTDSLSEFGIAINELPRFIADFSEKVLSETNEAYLSADAKEYFLLAIDTLNQAKRYAENCCHRSEPCIGGEITHHGLPQIAR